jgi:4-hydroxy-tetrahydrodipicolinate reductase
MRLVIAGASGRMGRELVRAVAARKDMVLAGAFDRPGAPQLGGDAGTVAGLQPLGVTISPGPVGLLEKADAVIDFTVPAATVQLSEKVRRAGLIHIIGTTGLEAQHMRVIAETAKSCAVVQSGNMSLGVNVLAVLVRQAAAALGPDWDIEIVEMHHNRKIDAPSGTALLFGQAAAEGRKVALADVRTPAREGETGARKPGTIGFAALRGGTVVGEHTVMLAGAGERIELTHRAEDRGLFATGALKAASWALGKPAGLYSMADVLGLPKA